jgi:hypothetical protein
MELLERAFHPETEITFQNETRTRSPSRLLSEQYMLFLRD